MNILNNKKLWVIDYAEKASISAASHLTAVNYISGFLIALSEKFCYGEEVNDIAFSSSTVFINCKDEGKAWHSVLLNDYMEFVASYGE